LILSTTWKEPTIKSFEDETANVKDETANVKNETVNVKNETQ
jgi:hypothetical protein